VSIDPDTPGFDILQDAQRRALDDPGYRRRLLDNPKAELTAAGVKIREEVQVVVVQNTANTVFLVLPSDPRVEEELGISDDLDVLRIINQFPF
jgi:hypothetical protein